MTIFVTHMVDKKELGGFSINLKNVYRYERWWNRANISWI